MRDEVKTREEVIEQVKKIPSERMAELKEVVQKLIESGFLLSPFHEALFLRTIGVHISKIHKTDSKLKLKSVSFSLHGTNGEDKVFRKGVARDMAEQLTSLGQANSQAFQISQWEKFSSSSQYDIALSLAKHYELYVKIPDLIKILNSLSNLYSSGKYEILLEVFELTLPDIFTVPRAREAHERGSYLVPIISGGLGAVTSSLLEVSVDHVSFLIIGLSTIFGATPVISNTIDRVSDLPYLRPSGTLKAFFVRNWKRRSIEKQTLNKAMAEIDGIVAEEAKSSDLIDMQNNQQDAKLDPDFNDIKLELKNRKLQGPIEISKWGSEFQNGITNLVERGQLLSSRVKKASENSKELQTEPLNDGTSASQRNQLRSSLNSQINFINDSLVVAFSMKADLLSLSAALDRYNELASQVNERTLSSSEKNILELTTRNLSGYKMQISAIATLLVNSEQAMINELNIAQMNLLSINDRSLIKSS